jgi:uracil-DNA glycosylase
MSKGKLMNPAQLRKEFSALIQKTRAYVEARQKVHPHARTLAYLARRGTVLEGPGKGTRPAGPENGSGADPRPPYAPKLEEFEAQIRQCRRCPLGASAKNFVFGSGTGESGVAFVGEAPGAEEDARGLPFVGPAGALLTKIIGAMGLKRDKVYICNLLKCRPPLNRDPKPGEIAACRPYLEHQLKLAGVRILVTLGDYATHAIIGQEGEGISALRGKRFEWRGMSVYPTYHPSALLRDEALKKHVWSDMKAVMKELA